MRTPSPAILVSTLALAVALTGTAGATGLINGQSIKNHSITANKLARGSVTAAAIRDHAIHKSALADGVIVNNTVIAPAGPQGDPGTPGANGVAVVDPTKLIVVNGPDITVAGNTRADAQAQCPDGTYVVGGGYSELLPAANADVRVTASQPLSVVNASEQGWDVVARNAGSLGETTGWHAIAYCAPVA